MRTTLLSISMAAMLVAATAAPGATQVVQEHVSGLLAPAKLLALPNGELLVAEGGNGPNTGRISFIDRDARRFTVIDGLPSAIFLGRDAGGPSGLLLGDRRLYVAIGAGDTTIAGAGAGSEIPNPAVSSPLFSSVLLLEFPDGAGPFSRGFTLPFAAHAKLAADQAVYLYNASGDTVRVSRLTDIPSYTAEPRPDEPRHVRIANPYGLVGSDSGLVVVDASHNALFSIALAPGGPLTRTANFANVPNPLFPALGGPTAEAVPAGIRVSGDDYVVSLLTGFPFGPGAASLFRVARATGAITAIASGLQTAVDVLPLSGTTDQFYVVEYSASFLTGGPGRVLLVDATRGTRLVLADGLKTPTHLAPDTRTGDLFVTENTGGRILRILVPH
ncbi:MAG: ScyD/ScyE family protein [Acidobacteriota bacterium]